MNRVYKIPLGEIAPNDLDGIRQLIENNESIFKNYVLSDFVADDPRYCYCDDSLLVEQIESDYFSFSAKVSYYAGCSDLNKDHDVLKSVRYKIHDSSIVFELDETPWDVR
ncbi:hypothetical protein [Providencia sp. PROV273]|uniref:hypothetical protein n=1 Tax=Providencia sp. PROV273 TaxID=2949960 RepID=UPI002349C298|nr:hypothetical protein [Providencia sp. PROV273]